MSIIKVRKTNNLWTEEERRYLITHKDEPAKKVAQKLGRSIHAVYVKRKHLGITSKKSNPLIKPDDIEEQIILGSVLGDGFIEQPKGRNAKLYFLHGEKQRDYMLWKANKLCRLGYHIGESVKPYTYNGVTKYPKRYHYYTDHNPYFNEMRKNWYPDGKKIFYIPDCEKLTPLGVLIWYFDDGDLGQRRVRFALHPADTSEYKQLINILEKLVKIRVNLTSYKQYYRLAIYGKHQIQRFRETVIDPFWEEIKSLECMHYKIPEAI